MSPGGYEGTFIKAGDSEKRKGLAWRKQQENLGWATRAHWEVRAEGLGDRFRGSAWDELPAAPCLEFRRRVPVGKEVGAEEGKGNGRDCPPEGEHGQAESFVLRLLSLLQAGILGEVSGEVCRRIFITSPGALSGSWSPLIGQWQGRGSSVIAIGSGITHMVLLLFGAWS